LGLLLIAGLPISLLARGVARPSVGPYYTLTAGYASSVPLCSRLSTDTLRPGSLLRVATDMEATLRAHGLRAVNGPLFLRHATRRKDTRAKLAARMRSWRVSLLRGRAHYLGNVDAPDERAAEVAAVAQFQLSDEQRKRLAVREE
jgi:hypothetical protein